MGAKMSSEVTGEGAIVAPTTCILCLKYNKASIINNTVSKLLAEDPSPDCDEGLASELGNAANDYINKSDLKGTNEKYMLCIVSENIETIDSIGKQVLAAITKGQQ